MPVKKNQIIPLTIESLSSDGSGIGHYEGEAVFVPATAPGDVLQVRIVKDMGRYAFGITEQVLSPSPDRRPADCAVAGPCGGCCFRHLTYPAELAAKRQFVADAFARIGGLALPVEPVLPSPEVERYRNKAQFPVGRDKNGRICVGFYAGRTHRIVPCADCALQPQVFNEIAAFLCEAFARYGIEPYDETSGSGLIRHIFLRRGEHCGQIMVCLVSTGARLPHAQALCAALRTQFPDIRSILLNINSRRTNVILGQETLTLAGEPFIEDTLCGVPIRLGPLSFYQVNTPAAEQLYRTAAAFAALQPGERLLDLYCGMGTIGLSMAEQCGELIGVEIVPEAIAAAKVSAARMGDGIAAKCRFFCADAGEAARRLAGEHLRPDVIVLDPPRKGCDEATLGAVVEMSPSRVVMVSCNPATAAWDVKFLAAHGYLPQKVQPADLFPRTKHVETVILLSRKTPDDTIEVDLDLDELDITSAESKATYQEIKDYVLKEFGLKVSTLYISQVKRKYGIEVGEHYNISQKENQKVPQCPKEKEDAIRAALEHFAMI